MPTSKIDADDAELGKDITANTPSKGGAPQAKDRPRSTGASPASADAEADRQAMIRKEEERIMAQVTCYRILCPSVEDKRDEEARKAAQEEGKSYTQGQASLFELWRFASSFDIALTIVGLIFAAAQGAVMPLFAVLFRDLFDGFQADDLTDQIS